MRKRDWSQLVKKVLAKHLLSQFELAIACDVSQQTVSSWKIGTRVPGYQHRRKLLDMYASKDLSDGPTLPEEHAGEIESAEEFNATYGIDPEEALLEKFRQLSPKRKKELAESARLKAIDERLAQTFTSATREATTLKTVLDSLPDIAWCGTFDKNFVFKAEYISPNFERLTGYAETKFGFNADEWESVLHPEDRAKYRSFCFNMLQNQLAEATIEYRIIFGSSKKTLKIRDRRRISPPSKKGAPCRIAGIIEIVR